MSYKNNRGVHLNPPIGTEEYKQGLAQRKIANERYHYLVAFLTGKIRVRSPYDHRDGSFSVDISKVSDGRKDLVFDTYEAFELKPWKAVKLHARKDGGIHPGDVKVYVDMIKSNWKIREAGILYAIDDDRTFANLYIHYLSCYKTTGLPEWDQLFARLKGEDFSRSIIPCMVCQHHPLLFQYVF
jgi:hypothetical protein